MKELDCHFTKEKLEQGIVNFVFSEEQIADILTKLGIVQYTSQTRY